MRLSSLPANTSTEVIPVASRVTSRSSGNSSAFAYEDTLGVFPQIQHLESVSPDRGAEMIHPFPVRSQVLSQGQLGQRRSGRKSADSPE